MRDPDVPWELSLELFDIIDRTDTWLTLVGDGEHRLSRDQDIARLIAAVAAF